MKPFDSNGVFQPTREGVELRRLAVRGAGVTVFSQGVAFAIQMISTVVLARLLTPVDFGVVTMVTTFSLLLMSFGLNGLPEAVVQREEINHRLVSNLFWISIGMGLLLAIGFAAAGSLLARFYGNPLVAQVAAVMSFTIFFGSASVLHIALLKRAMRFTAVAFADVIARAASVAVSILLAWAGWGYWALVAGAIALPVSQTVAAWSLCRWMPGRPRRTPGTGSMLRFAIHTFGHFGVNYFARNMDNLLVGWRFNALALGFYKKAYDLFAFTAGGFLSPVESVVVSTLSRLNRDKIQYRRYLLSGLSILAFAAMGVGGDLTLVGRDLIRLLLGPRWEESGRIFTYFGPGIGPMLICSAQAWIHLSIGTPDRWFRWGILEFGVTGALFLLALPWGPAGIAAAWTASFWILTIPAFWYAGRPIQFGVAPVLGAIWKYVLASALAVCLCAGIIGMVPPAASSLGGAAVRIVTISLLFSSLYVGAVILLHRGCAPIYQVGRLLSEFVPWRRSRLSPLPEVAVTYPHNPQEDSLLQKTVIDPAYSRQ